MAHSHNALFLFGLGFQVALGLLAVVAGQVLHAPPFATWPPQATWSVRASELAIGLLAVGPLYAIFCWLVLNCPWDWAKQLRVLSMDFVRFLEGPGGTWKILLLSVAAGVGEELLFRGLCLQWFGALLGQAAGIVLSNVLFGMMHAVTLPYMVFAGAFGLYFTALHYLTGGLLASMICHAAYDALALFSLRNLASRKQVGTLDQTRNSWPDRADDRIL